MQLILHLGMGKTGTSALQAALARLRPGLLERGILYPDLVPGKVHHNQLAMGLMRMEHLARLPLQACGGEERRAEEIFRGLWDRLRAEIDRSRPETVVISGENLFRDPIRCMRRDPRTLFSEITAEIRPVVYLRRPSAYHLSVEQQHLKASGTFQPPAPARWRPAIEGFERVFGPGLEVLAYERGRLQGADIRVDFFARFLPQALPLLETLPPSEENRSVSAEAMEILQRYRRLWHPDADHRATADTREITAALRAVDAETGGAKPRLRPEIARFIDQGSVDLLWLRDRFGITFDGVDYEAIREPDPAEADRFAGISAVRELCPVDPARVEHALLRALKELLARPSRARPDS